MNEELMLNDQSYKDVTGSGGGYSTGRDVTIDDEDFDDEDISSADGSGSGSTTPVHTPEPVITTTTRAPSIVTPKSGPKDSAGHMTASFTMLLLCAAVWCRLCKAL
ncbi:unnamed protein product [Lymnaea stagnalis]|uniref:Uncharacterized protein n=1 Tax=Lymnaea stagnalis TaxID=6523 RepID=A0AAV2ID30_LYMST